MNKFRKLGFIHYNGGIQVHSSLLNLVLHEEPAVTGWTVCRFHGARGGGPKGERNGMYRHGLNTKEAVKERRFLSDLLRQSRAMLCEEIQ